MIGETQNNRGYAGIGLYCPKNSINVGATLRAAGVYGAAFVAVTGNRYHRAATDTMKDYRHMPLLQVDDLHSVVPFDCVPVAVEILPGARCLFDYSHPERAFYIFGPEDSSLGARVLEWCRDVVYIPTRRCMNLAATVNVVLYDRAQKTRRPPP